MKGTWMNIVCSGRRLCGCLALALAVMSASGDTLNWTGGANGHLRYVPGGVYGGPSAGLDAAHTLSFITGTGTILVKRSGHPGTLIDLH